MPSDVTGVNVLGAGGTFSFRPGPLFGDLVLADEINRAPAKTQAALLEAMQERSVTVDGVSHPLSAAFTVFATQNPIEFEGTYPLPEAELDRFLVKVLIGYPESETEQAMLQRVLEGFEADDPSSYGIDRPLGGAALGVAPRHPPADPGRAARSSRTSPPSCARPDARRRSRSARRPAAASRCSSWRRRPRCSTAATTSSPTT